MKITLHCPHCRAKLKAKNDRIGRKVPCPKCGESFVIPERPPKVAERLPKDVEGAPSDFADLDRSAAEPEHLNRIDAPKSGGLEAEAGVRDNMSVDPLASTRRPAKSKPNKDLKEQSSRRLPIAAITGCVGIAAGLFSIALWFFTDADGPEVAQESPPPAVVAAPSDIGADELPAAGGPIQNDVIGLVGQRIDAAKMRVEVG